MPDREYRSHCPVNLAVEILGDRWSLIVLRDVMFGDKRHFRELHRSDEGIAFNILADRLRKLVDLGLLTKADNPHHKQKATYSLTEIAIDLVPVFVHLGLWAIKHLAVDDAMSARILFLANGGPQMWEDYQRELREVHLTFSGAQAIAERPIAEALETAFRAASDAETTGSDSRQRDQPSAAPENADQQNSGT
jgi:DNA-binding HxlR family transcriptional regulator